MFSQTQARAITQLVSARSYLPVEKPAAALNFTVAKQASYFNILLGLLSCRCCALVTVTCCLDLGSLFCFASYHQNARSHVSR